MGLFDGAFDQNDGWLGSAMKPYIDMGNSFSRPGNNGLFEMPSVDITPGSFAHRLIYGVPGPNQPSMNPADYAGLADAFGGGGSMPPQGMPQRPTPMNISGAPEPAGNAGMSRDFAGDSPTLDQRAYGMAQAQQPPMAFAQPGGAAQQQFPSQATQAMAQAQPEPDFLKGLSNFSHNIGSTPGLPGIIDAIRGTQTGQRYDAAGKSEQNQQTTMQAVAQSLIQRGYPQEVALGMARAASIDPKVAEKILGEAYAIPKTAEEYAVRQASMPDGQKGGNPFDILRQKTAATSAGETEGKRVADAQLDLPNIHAQGQESIRLTDELLKHPGRDSVFWHTPGLGKAPLIPGTEAYNAHQRLEQLKGATFLNVYPTLKGGGAITNVEGEKAVSAVNRMDRATSREEFDTAAKDYKNAIRRGYELLSQTAGRPVQPQQAQQSSSSIPPPPSGFRVQP